MLRTTGPFTDHDFGGRGRTGPLRGSTLVGRLRFAGRSMASSLGSFWMFPRIPWRTYNHLVFTRARWIEGRRQWAPWFFAETAMLRDSQQKLHLLPIETKEALHHFDRDYSASPNVGEKDRHRLLGNSWHLGVATEILRFSLMYGVRTLPGPCAPEALDVSKLRDLASAEKLAGQHPLSMQRQPEMCDHVDMQPASDMWEHWELSASAVHPLYQRPHLDPAIELTLQRLLRFPADQLADFRGSVIRDIAARKVQMQGATRVWFDSLPTHVQAAYSLPDGDIVQIPLFISLLRGCGYPDADALEASLSRGFPVLGPVDPSPGWRPRLDERYDHPISAEAFRDLNEAYVRQKLLQGRVDPEWEALLTEVIQEVKLGRMTGPYRAPAHWPRQCVPIASHSGFTECLELQGEVRVANAFSVVQQGSDGSRKVRRCEDYRRSGHNSTIHVQDIPAHDDINRYVQILLRLVAAGHETQVWCQDLWAAYRQFPLERPSDAFALILTPWGPSLWQHGVLPFGGASSVWCFNKCVDALTFLARSLLLILLIHFVDDIGCPDAGHSASSSFRFFSALCDLLGMRLKPSKAQPPASKHKLLGVLLEITAEGIRLAPAPDRVSKVLEMIQAALEENILEPVVAQRLTGKLNFLCTTLFGQAAASAMKPLYSRAHDRNDQDHAQLNGPLRCSLVSLKSLLQHAQPRWVPFNPESHASAVLYADAFFELGDRKFGLSDEPPDSWFSTSSRRYKNGWGFVVRSGSTTRFASGTVPSDVLCLFTSRRAYIYCLEIFGQVIAALTCRDILPQCWIGFCDNTAGKAALVRGYGRDANINNLLACFWAVAQRLGWQPHFEWVPSDCNLADPFSRGDCSIGHERGWSVLRNEADAFWPIFKRVATDLEYALEGAPGDLLNLSWAFE
ncbi:DSK2B [Symbiodinium sp. CCMP2592]|nr:DSK2B [Symbiodinium sp. CCMP2592]